MKKYIFGLGAMLVGPGLMFVSMHGEVEAKDRDMMEMIEMVVFSQKFKECRKTTNDKIRLRCFDNLNEKIKVQMKIFQNALDFNVPKKNWYGLQTETNKVKKKDTQSEYMWGEKFLSDVERVMEKIELYFEENQQGIAQF